MIISINLCSCRCMIHSSTKVILKMTVSVGCFPIIAIFESKDKNIPENVKEQNAVAMSSKNENTSTTTLVANLKPGCYYFYYGFIQSNTGVSQLKIYSSYPVQFF